MADEYVVYSRSWFHERAKYFFRDIARSIAFGLIMSLSFAFLFISLFIFNENGFNDINYISDTFDEGLSLLGIVVFGIPLCVLCWWGAIEVADDSHWEKEVPSVWDNQEARMLESTLYLARQLESRGKEIVMSLVLSKDIRSKAHHLQAHQDEPALRLYMVAVMAGLSEHTAIAKETHVKGSKYLNQPPTDVDSNE